MLSAPSEPIAALIRSLAARTANAAVAAIASCVIVAATYGHAARLGATENGFGADARVTASCGSGIHFGYTTAFDAGLSRYAVTGIDLSNVPAGCLGKSIFVTFYDLAGNDVGPPISATLAGSGTTQHISIAPNASTVDASRVGGLSVVIP